jgi:hypothetical protein
MKVLKKQIVLVISSHCSEIFVRTRVVECERIFDSQKSHSIIRFWVYEIGRLLFHLLDDPDIQARRETPALHLPSLRH